jgi:hypothetical protein
MNAPLLPTPTPDWALERYALGVLPPELEAEVTTRLSDEPGAAARLAALPESDREIFQRHPPKAVAATLSARHRRAQTRRFWGPAAGIAVAALALFLILPGPDPAPAEGPAPPTAVDDGVDAGVRGKGPAQLTVFRRGAEGDELLVDGAEVSAGDHLQLAVRSPAAAWAVVVSVDGEGAVTVHTPRPLRVESDQAVGLPASFRLDDAPAFERFFLVTAEAAPDVDQIADAIAALLSPDDALVLPPGNSHISLTLYKTEEI